MAGAVSTIASSIPSRSAASSPRCARSSSFCCARKRSRPMPRALLRTPKAPKRVPIVPTAEQTNTLVDGVAPEDSSVRIPERDLAALRTALRLRPAHQRTGRAESRRFRLAPNAGFACAAKAARNARCHTARRPRRRSQKYLAARARPSRASAPLFVNHRGTRLSDRGAREIVKFYARMIAGRRVAASAQLAPRLCDAPAGRRRRSARDSGTAGPRAPGNHAEVHAGVADGFDGGVRPGAPEGRK